MERGFQDPRTTFSMENKPVLINLGTILPQRASVTHILMSKAPPVWALGGKPKYQMRGVEVICNVGDRNQGGSTRHAHPIVVAQRLRGAQNGVAGALLRTVPGTGLGGSVSPQEAADAGPGTWPKKLQVDPRITVLALWVGSNGWIFCCLLPLRTPATSASEGGSAVFAKPEGSGERLSQPLWSRAPSAGPTVPGPGRPRSAPPPPPGPRRTRSLIPRPTLPRRRPRRAGDALTASRWSPAEASAAHNAPRAAIPLPPSPARLAFAARMLIRGGWGVRRGRGHGGGGGHVPPCSLRSGAPRFSERPPQIPAPEKFLSLNSLRDTLPLPACSGSLLILPKWLISIERNA